MGSIIGSRAYFVDSLIDIAGYKAGVIVSEAELFTLMKGQGVIADIIDPAGPGGGRIHSTDFSDAVVYLLYKLGNLKSPDNIPWSMELFHKYKKLGQYETYYKVQRAFLDKMPAELDKPNDNGKLDPSAFIREAFEVAGRLGLGLTTVNGIALLPHEPLLSRAADGGALPKGAARGAAKAKITREQNAERRRVRNVGPFRCSSPACPSARRHPTYKQCVISF